MDLLSSFVWLGLERLLFIASERFRQFANRVVNAKYSLSLSVEDTSRILSGKSGYNSVLSNAMNHDSVASTD